MEPAVRGVEQPEFSPIVRLQSLDSEGLCLWAAPVSAINPAYSLEFSPDDARVLGVDARQLSATAREILCLAILCALENGPLTANLLAPVIVILATRIAVQAVRSDNRYSKGRPRGCRVVRGSHVGSEEAAPFSEIWNVYVPTAPMRPESSNLPSIRFA
jgi:flagellar assembly factor FliW